MFRPYDGSMFLLNPGVTQKSMFQATYSCDDVRDQKNHDYGPFKKLEEWGENQNQKKNLKTMVSVGG